MPDEPEEGFTVRDRRRFSVDTDTTATVTSSSDASASASPVAASPVAAEPADPVSSAPDAAMETTMGGDILEEGDEMYDAGQLPDVYSILALFMGELRNLAWLRMGLVANPGTGEIERDLPQAKVAIDTVGYLAMQLEAVVAPDERLPLKAMVSDLQVNFLEQSKRAQ